MKLPGTSDFVRLMTSRGIRLRDCLGLAFAFAGQALYRSSLSLFHWIPGHTRFIDAPSLWSMIANIVALALVVVFAHRPGRSMTGWPIVVSAVAALTVGNALLLLHPSWIGLSASTEAALGGALVSLGSLGLILAWVEKVARLDVSSMLTFFGIAVLISAAVKFLTLSLGTLAGGVVIALIPLASGLMLIASPRASEADTLAKEALEHEQDAGMGVVDSGWWIQPLWRWCLTLGLYGIALGAIEGAWTRNLDQTVLGIAVAIRLSIYGGQAIGAVVVLAGVWILGSERVRPWRQIALPLLMITLYLSTVLTGAWSLLYVVLHSISTPLIGCLVWIAMSSRDLHREHSAVYIYATATFWFSGLTTLMVLLGVLTPLTPLLAVLHGGIVSIAVLWLLLPERGSLFRTGESALSESTLSTDPGTDQSEADSLAARCTRVAEIYHLTKREQDILQFLARGRDTAHIASVHTIGRETVRTHTHNIYQKTGVHSQQELMDLIEKCGSQ
jgi:DNA-binding CsgD family transcriptional regulator